MANRFAQFDHVFQALADPTRRTVIERLGRGSAPVGELAEPFDMALPSFLQHLSVLEDCGLVRSRKVGRVRTFQVEPQSLKKVDDWMSRQRKIWETRLDQFDDYVKKLKEKKA